MTCSTWPGSASTADGNGPASIPSSIALPSNCSSSGRSAVDQRRQIEHLLALRLAAGKGQQLRDKPGSAQAVAANFGQAVMFIVAWRVAVRAIARSAQHGGEDVVEIMRDTAGELAHGLHAGCRCHLRFQSQLFANVAHRDQRRDAKTRRHRARC